MTQTPENQQQYGSILTILGENAEQNGKQQNKQITFTHMAIGDANDEYVQPNRKQSALVNELARIPVNSVDVLQPTPDSVPMLKVEAILPDDVNDLVIREFAAVATFDGNTYFHAVGNNARIYVPPPVNNGNVSTPVTLEMIFVITSAEPIVEIDPNVVTASREWVVNLDHETSERLSCLKIHPKNQVKNTRVGDKLDDINAVIIQGTLYPLLDTVKGEVSGINLISKPYTISIDGHDHYLMNMRYFKDDVINIDAFWCEGNARNRDGTDNEAAIDDTVCIQAALVYGVVNNRTKIIASSNKSYKTSDTIYIPTTYRSPNEVTKQPGEGRVVIDFQGAEFIGRSYTDTDCVLFESGYFDEHGELKSVFGQSPEMYLTSGTTLENYTCRNYHVNAKLRNWIYGCAVRNVFGVDVAQMLKTERCFYSHFEQVVHRGAYVDGVPIFHFSDNNNIMPLKGLVSGNCDIAYQFDGAVEALRMVDCGIEGFKSYGVITTGDYNITFDSCYFESGKGIGYSGKGTNHVTFENCWGYGDFPMLGDFTDNTNVRIRNNNNLGGGCRWYDDLPDYCIADFDLPNVISAESRHINVYDAPPAINVDQDITVYRAASGLARVLGRVEQTNKYHTQRVNGKMTDGFGNGGVGFTHTVTPIVDGRQTVEYMTNIDWSDTQCIWCTLKVNHNSGTWVWVGFVSGDGDSFRLNGDNTTPLVVENINGKVRITTPSFGSGGNLGVLLGEIRII
ncbi:phage tail protein [Vibrio sp. 10N.261.51.E5]|uniref:phage tail-collar fiber domain-containing protein n=1 Tax=Vibrio sp. 10N.261.51.E5 TaxID=3229677 RepID=UPI00354FF35E